MGGHLGNLYKIRGIIYYRLSPYELRPFKGFFSKGIPNTIRRITTEAPFIVPPFFITWVVYDYASSENARLSRKNPADYANDV